MSNSSTIPAPSPSDVALCRTWADFYRLRGFNPLPSRPDAKRPMVRFRAWWDVPAPGDLFDRHPTTNVQVMTGRAWRLLAIDLDGPEARDRFSRMGRTPRTWAVHSGGDGVHLWFSLPAGMTRPMPKAFLWKGEGGHSAIERLCDRSLVMAPPSIHPATGVRYRFRSPGESPAKLPLPAPCPAWVLDAPALDLRPAPAPFVPARPAAPRAVKPGRYDRRAVLDAIPDKVEVARRWGLRVAGREGANGFIPCHAIGREDRVPSAGIHAATGTYAEPGAGLTLSLFDLGVALGQYRDFRDAVNDLGANHVG